MTGRILSFTALLALVAGIALLSAQADDKSRLPASDLPFSQTVTTGDLIFVSGQVGIDPETKKMAGPDITAQTRQALLNIERQLKAAGSDLSQVVKTTVFLTDIQDYAAMNEAYKQVFGATRPARSTVAVAGLVAGAVIEIDAIAVKSGGKIEHR